MGGREEERPKPGAKYFKSSIIEGERRCRIIVWDGVHDNATIPEPAPLFDALFKSGEFSEDGSPVGIVYCNTKDRAVSIVDVVKTVAGEGCNNIFVLCR